MLSYLGTSLSFFSLIYCFFSLLFFFESLLMLRLLYIFFYNNYILQGKKKKCTVILKTFTALEMSANLMKEHSFCHLIMDKVLGLHRTLPRPSTLVIINWGKDNFRVKETVLSFVILKISQIFKISWQFCLLQSSNSQRYKGIGQ